MALFSTKKKNMEKESVDSSVHHTARSLSWVLKNPRITEKATDVSGRSVYVFDVAIDANKTQVGYAVAQIYKVTPVRVNVVPVRAKTVRNAKTGMRGKTVAGKKAYVFLKKGDTISLI